MNNSRAIEVESLNKSRLQTEPYGNILQENHRDEEVLLWKSTGPKNIRRGCISWECGNRKTLIFLEGIWRNVWSRYKTCWSRWSHNNSRLWSFCLRFVMKKTACLFSSYLKERMENQLIAWGFRGELTGTGSRGHHKVWERERWIDWESLCISVGRVLNMDRRADSLKPISSERCSR